MSLMDFELKLKESQNYNFIGGIDEVGRGCLAGPLVTAIVVYDIDKLMEISQDEKINQKISLIKDSKKLTEKRREELDEFIKSICFYHHINIISNDEIDNLGISKATNNSFYSNFLSAGQNSKIDFLLTDAFKIKGLNEEIQQNIIKGDSTSLCIASASIIAKVFRDNFMKELAKNEEYKIYDFDSHKGYGTAAHIEIIKKCGASNMHRKSFEPIRSMLLNNY